MNIEDNGAHNLSHMIIFRILIKGYKLNDYKRSSESFGFQQKESVITLFMVLENS